ncbi:methyltransferase [Rhodopila sp.]|uniref:methyltransferase n=1 Tax=Rhodopila sp. TaxID=2480087 RepID=UPI003D115D01
MADVCDHALPGQPDRSLMSTPEVPGLDLLQCPVCGGPLSLGAIGRIACRQCHASVPVREGIIDFVAGSASTDLDHIDYDQFYAITEKNSAHLYRIIKASAGPLWPMSLGDAVEIGCGTGGFTMAVLRETAASNVILTDISTKMLGLCRARLARFADLRANSLTFATYGGKQACFRPDAFDTCFGTAVVHHITDVPDFLAQVQRLLKPGGRAFFMEPNLRFHAALTATLAMILGEWLSHGTVPRADISRMANWLAEVHCNIVNSGDLDVLVEREDKHLFVGETFEAMAEAAGFGVASALPGGLDPTGLNTVGTYLDQTGVSHATLDRLRANWPAAQNQHFGSLQPRDQSPSYLFWLQKKTRKKPVWQAASRRLGSPLPASTMRLGSCAAEAGPPTQLCLTFALRRHAEGLQLEVDGWCLTAEMVKSLRVTAGGQRNKLPIWRPRLDVQTMLNRDRRYPAVHALCSGVEGKLPVADVAAGNKPIQVMFDIVTVDDRLLRGRSIMLVPDGDSRTIQIDSLGEPQVD